MQAPKSLWKQIQQFTGAGILAAGTNYAVYFCLMMLTPIGAAGSMTLGFLLGTIVSYTLNTRFTFEGEFRRSTFTKFWIVTLVGGGINVGLAESSVRLGIHFGIGGIIAIGLAAAFNFIGHKLWTFR